MQALTDITRYDESLASYSKDKLWALFNGNRDQINIAHETLTKRSCSMMEQYLVANPDFLKDLAASSYFGGKMNHDFFRNFNNSSEISLLF